MRDKEAETQTIDLPYDMSYIDPTSPHIRRTFYQRAWLFTAEIPQSCSSRANALLEVEDHRIAGNSRPAADPSIAALPFGDA
jgi:hypothetical protein